MSEVRVVKIGGNVIDNEEALEHFLADFVALEGPKVLVHGGGKIATRMAEQLGIATTMLEGRRVTDRAMLDVVTMVYAGLINKRIVATLQRLGCNALGLSGADAAVVRAHRRPATPVDYGYVGDIDEVDGARLYDFVSKGLTPVICSIHHDSAGTLLNCNADSVATAVALGMAQVATTSLYFCFDKAGVLRDVNDEQSLICEITADSYPQLKAEGVISDGMIPKVENALKAVAAGLRSVTIKSSCAVADTAAGTTIK